MKRILLILAGSIVVILVIFGVFVTKNKEHPSTLNQLEITKESTDSFVKSVPTTSSPQPKQASEKIGPSEKEREEEFEALPKSLEEKSVEDIQSEIASETKAPLTEALETEDSKTRISPELEAIFTVVKNWRDKARAIDREIVPLINQYAALGQREQEIGNAISGTSGEENRRLHEELRQIQSEKQKLANLMDPLGAERDQITQELEQYLQTNYGMSIRQFFDTYSEVFDAWRKAQ